MTTGILVYGIYAFGAISVLVVALQRFNTPVYALGDPAPSDLIAPPRYLTSRMQYWFWLCVYLALMGTFYLALIPGLKPVLALTGVDLPANLDTGPVNAMIAALLLTSFLPNVPGFEQLERYFRAALHRMARIPRHARELHQAMSIDELEVDPEWLSLLPEDSVARRGATADVRTIERKWSACRYLMEGVENWANHSAVRSYMGSPESQWGLIHERFDGLRQAMLLRKRRTASQDRDDVDDQINKSLEILLQRLFGFISCALLAYEPSEKARYERLRKLGFVNFKPPPRVPLDLIAFILMMLGCFVFLFNLLGTAILRALGWAAYTNPGMVSQGSIEGALQWAFIAIMFHGSTVVLVLFCRRWLAGQWPEPSEPLAWADRRWLTYAAMGALGFGVSAGLLFGTGLLKNVPTQWWWGFLSAATGFFVAFHIDTLREHARPWLESGVQALGTAVVAYVCSMQALHIPALVPSTLGEQVFVGFTTLQAAAIGGFIGGWVPYAYRHQGDRASEIQQEPEPPIGELSLEP